jgi:hypothetical protein
MAHYCTLYAIMQRRLCSLQVTATVPERLVDLALVEMVEELLRQPTELLILDQVAAVGTLPLEPSVVLE